MSSEQNKLLEKKLSRWYGADHFNERPMDNQKHETVSGRDDATKLERDDRANGKTLSISHDNTNEQSIKTSVKSDYSKTPSVPTPNIIVIPTEHPKVTWGCKIPLELYDFIKAHDTFCYILPDPRTFRKKFIEWLMELKEKNMPFIEEAEKALNTVKLDSKRLKTQINQQTSQNPKSDTELSEGYLPQKQQQSVSA